MIGHLWEPKLVGRDLGVTHAHVTCVSEAAKVMQESTDDKMSCFVVAVVVAGVTPGIYIRERKEGREGREGRGAVFLPGGKFAGALHEQHDNRQGEPRRGTL